MPFEFEFDDDLAQRRLQRLEHRYRRAHSALNAARAEYESLRLQHAGEPRIFQALQSVKRAEQITADIRFDLEFFEAQVATPRPPDHYHWRDIGG